MLLGGCTPSLNAVKSEALYQAPPWPTPSAVQMQSGVAKYITRGHSAYMGCVANINALKQIENNGENND